MIEKNIQQVGDDASASTFSFYTAVAAVDSRTTSVGGAFGTM